LDISSNKYSKIKISQNENKLLNKTEVQETRPSNVISSKLCIPVHNRTGKKHGVGLNVIDTIGKTMSALQECAKSPSLSIVTTVVLDLPVLLNLPLIGTGSLSHILRQYLFIVPHR
jgi:hypothetical protein